MGTKSESRAALEKNWAAAFFEYREVATEALDVARRVVGLAAGQAQRRFGQAVRQTPGVGNDVFNVLQNVDGLW